MVMFCLAEGIVHTEKEAKETSCVRFCSIFVPFPLWCKILF